MNTGTGIEKIDQELLMDQPLASTKITGSQIEKWLTEYFREPLKLKDCKAQQIGDGEGYTSTILRVSLKYENGRDSYPKSLILKTPSLPALEDLMKKLLSTNSELDSEQTIAFSTMIHTVECAAYKAFGENPPIPLPIVYAATECKKNEFGAILMEDFGGKASIIGDATCTLTLQQVYAAADAVANWNAWCLTTDEWKPHFEPADSERRMQIFAGWADMMRQCFERVKIKYPNVFTKVNGRVADQAFDFSRLPEKIKQQRAVMPDVIVHGDFYANNLMYDISKDETGKIKVGSKLLCIVDWAMAYRGCGMADFARLLTLSVDTEIRRQHTNDILRHYYDTLVKKVGVDRVKASFEDVLKLYNSEFVHAGLFFVLMLDWLQNLFVRDTGEVGERKRDILFQRCLAVYEDFVPIIEKDGI